MPSPGPRAEDPTHVVVVCTRNRPDDIGVALDSLVGQSLAPTEVLVVDSSDDAATERVVAARSFPFPVRYLHSEPGLTHQRNVGVAASSGDVVHFIDDDVVLDDDYLREVVRSFVTGGPDVVGVGGLIASTAPRRPRWWWRAALVDSRRQGCVLSSGVNILVTDLAHETDVEWLSGCSMSYRRRVFDELSFDEALQGYALMEDVDFSYGARRLGRLVLNPAAGLTHKVSDVGRWDHHRRVTVGVHRRGWFVEKHLPRRALVAFVWSVVAGAAVHAVLGVLTLSRWRVRVAGWQLQALGQFFRGRR